MNEKKILEVPQETTKDVLQRLLSAAISEVPGGTLATEFFQIMVTPAIVERKESFLKDLLKSLNALEQTVEGFKLSELSSNQRFVTTVLQIVPIAIKTHQKEKLEALRNAALNAAVDNKFDDFYIETFLGFIDQLTPLHIHVLKVFSNPKQFVEKNDLLPEFEKGEKDSTEICFPQLSDSDLADQIIQDLKSRGLIIKKYEEFDDYTDSWGELRGEERRFKQYATDLGRNFLRFISNPLV